MKIISARHAWPERKGFRLTRRKGHENWSFLHFWKPVQVLVNGELQQTRPNAVLIIKKGVPQELYSPDNELVHDWFHFDGEDVEEALSKAGLECDKLYYPKNCSFITELVQEIEGELFADEKNKDELVSNYLSVLLTILGRRIAAKDEEYAVDYQTQIDFKNLRNRVFSNLDRNWTINLMAEQVNLSESRFYAVYKAIFKTTPNQDLILARMDYAKRILSQNTTAAILDVALECGYSNEFHFIRQFKKHVGITPKQYALLYRNN